MSSQNSSLQLGPQISPYSRRQMKLHAFAWRFVPFYPAIWLQMNGNALFARPAAPYSP